MQMTRGMLLDHKAPPAALLAASDRYRCWFLGLTEVTLACVRLKGARCFRAEMLQDGRRQLLLQGKDWPEQITELCNPLQRVVDAKVKIRRLLLVDRTFEFGPAHRNRNKRTTHHGPQGIYANCCFRSEERRVG